MKTVHPTLGSAVKAIIDELEEFDDLNLVTFAAMTRMWLTASISFEDERRSWLIDEQNGHYIIRKEEVR